MKKDQFGSVVLSVSPCLITDPVKAFEYAQSRVAYELGQTMHRNNFFMLFQGVVVAGAFNIEWTIPFAQSLWIVVSVFGIFLSSLQLQMAAAGRYHIIRSIRFAKARELDVIAAVEKGQAIYHVFTDELDGSTHKSSHSKTDYSSVSPLWKEVGFSFCPKDEPAEVNQECNFIGRQILRAGLPSKIAIWVAVALLWFWILALIIQIFDVPGLLKIAFTKG